MSVIETPAIPVLSNPADRKKLRGMLEEIGVILTAMDDKKIQKKILLDEIKHQFNLSPKHANKLAVTMHKGNYDEVTATAEDFETLYETIVKMTPPVVLRPGIAPDEDNSDDTGEDE